MCDIGFVLIQNRIIKPVLTHFHDLPSHLGVDVSSDRCVED